MWKTTTVPFLLLCLVCLSDGTRHEEKDNVVKRRRDDYSHLIFNTIHHAMRQFGSTLNHNGMSLFYATVPANTELYHGTDSSTPVKGREWLAFEPEHAMLFARPSPGRPPKAKKRSQVPLNDIDGPYNGHPVLDDLRDSEDEDEDDGSEQALTGYLHTFRTKHQLRLLYLDGQSAAKSTKGTLDTQDILLRNGTEITAEDDDDDDGRNRPGRGGPMGDWDRADDLCEMASTAWNGKVDGILRMEAGFEIILCSFAAHLEVVGVHAVPKLVRDSEEQNNDELFNYFNAVAARYNGIGNHRVALDLERMVSLYDYSGIVYFDSSGWPRLVNPRNSTNAAASSTFSAVQINLQTMLTETGDTTDTLDWQGITDMIVSRYADRIEWLASGQISNTSEIRFELDRALKPFINYANRSTAVEIEKCVHQFWPSRHPRASVPTTASKAIKSVLYDICTTLSGTTFVETREGMLQQLRDLKTRLDWTVWRRCRDCKLHEYCLVPIWPIGNLADFQHPRCSNGSDLGGEYWRPMRSRTD